MEVRGVFNPIDSNFLSNMLMEKIIKRKYEKA